MTRLHAWLVRRSTRRDKARLCHDLGHIPKAHYGYRHGVWCELGRVCARCGKALP